MCFALLGRSCKVIRNRSVMMVEQGELVPPGFRFHPTEEELVGYYLARKVARSSCDDLDIIQEVDLYRIEPWDLQERCKLGGAAGHDDGGQTTSEWYFFSYKDRKYPSGTRTNRATAAGFWKATGRDKPVLSSSRVIGMRKTLVFYKGRAPNGRKTDWIMHEYRLQPSNHQEEGWVVCRAFQKPIPNQRPFVFPTYATPAGYCYDHLPSMDGSHQYLQVGGGPAPHALAAGNSFFPQQFYSDDDDLLESKKHDNLFSSILPPLESPTAAIAACAQQRAAAHVVASENDDELMVQGGGGHAAAAAAGAIDWNFLDTLLSTTTSQLLEPSTLLQ
ncbi:hypothetical protein SEVIR_3G003900v4 [Setaria viridis]|uniref:NAC domain-containing protein n=2 Tax=Setaria viridis TaxID=4556 RepID=A0A4U6V9K6_SETVI|nr:NAC domain-containing protein 30-like isoform X1 [Setaria viridis]TKW23699.1 hypothetical protein SEVIR_3G003900v2 [Setaria viridis]